MPSSQELLAPSGAKARFEANVAALRVLRQVQAERRPATAAEQAVLARWGSWGAAGLWQVFDPDKPEWDAERARLRELLTDAEYAAARRTTLNAHFTDPALVAPVWSALLRLGFTGGPVLEPGCGAGTFIGLAPASAVMVGVELDPVTAGIAAALYPQATIRNESFAATVFPAGHFEAAVGNVPFSDVVLHDPRYNQRRLSLHNHFIAKAVELTRPGGLVAVITSRYTMDAVNPAARRVFAEQADLVAAIRLPNGAHRRAAGTEAASDLLILRRRGPDDPPGTPFEATEWLPVPNRSASAPDEVESARLNRYWLEHPEHVLGTLVGDVGAHGVFALQVEPDPSVPAGEALEGALDRVVAGALASGSGFAPRTPGQQQRAAGFVPAMPDDIDGMVWAGPNGTFSVVEDGARVPLRLPRGVQAPELAALLRLRDQARALIAAEAASLADTDDLAGMRARLASGWRGYVQAYGPINRYTTRRTGRTHPDTGEETVARVVPPAVRLLLGDPYGALVLALEVFDGERQVAEPASILTCRQIVPAQPVQGVDTAADGLAVVLDRLGRVDIDEIARLLGSTPTEAIAALGDQVFTDPVTGQWVTRAGYLSGDVRSKLDAARAAELAEPGRWQANVAALAAVLPVDIPAGDIATGLGAIWIPDADYSAFLQHLTGNPADGVRRLVGSAWEVTAAEWGTKATVEWGTRRLPVGRILQHLLGQEPLQVFDTVDDKRLLNPLETTAAVEKGRALQAEFNGWVWTDPERTARLVAEYNRRFNSTVLRDYSFEGGLLSLPGLSRAFTPRLHQRAAIARMIHEPSVGLFHSVGAGKTAEMIIGIAELKRLGLIRKAAVVVPNHMLNQFAADWLQLYPQARILAAGADDLAGDDRRRFIAKIATHDWDAVILTRTAFQRIPLSAEHEQDFETRQVADARAKLDRLGGGDSPAFRRLERSLLAREQKLRALRDVPHDDGLTWEATGFDYLAVDELHDFKNLQTISSIRDVAIEGSKRALDLFAKIDYHRNTLGQQRVMVGATATPIANSIAEMYVMQRYLDPAGLARVGIEDMDSWLATFAEVVTAPELSVAGGERLVWKSRVAKFNNVPELLGLFHGFADVKTAADLRLPCPPIAARPSDGEPLPNTIIVPRSPQLAAYTAALGERADRVAAGGVDPEIDNLLKIGVDGRRAALDLRLIDHTARPVGPSKISVAADLLHRVWRHTRGYRYLDAAGALSAVAGALQIVFCDLSTPGPGFTVYNQLKDALIDRGLPAQQIRFIHEARTDPEKARLLQACRTGHVAVLIGSTAKLGTGVNIQHRVIHLLHLDAPWRPADLVQRDGRGLRQLNQNRAVMVTNIVTDASFDAFMWSALERKARFIDQVMTGRGVDRTVEDIGQATLNYAEIKASIAGNPLLLEQAEAEREVRRLTRLAQAHDRSEWSLKATISHAETELAQIAEHLPLLEHAATLTEPTKGSAFRLQVPVLRFYQPVGERTITERAAAVPELRRLLDATTTEPVRLGRLGGHDIIAERLPGTQWGVRRYRFTLADAPGVAASTDWLGRGAPSADLGTVTRLEHLTQAIPGQLTTLQLRQAQLEVSVTQARALQGRPFPHTQALIQAQDRLAVVAAQLAATRSTPTDPLPAAGPALPGTDPAVVTVAAAIPGPPLLPEQPDQPDDPPPAASAVPDRPAPGQLTDPGLCRAVRHHQLAATVGPRGGYGPTR